MARKAEIGKTPASATIIGLGGIGSWLVQTAAPMMAFDERHDWTLTLVDGDKYTASNISRQAFDPKEAGEYKADVQARWVMRRFPNVRVHPWNLYVREYSHPGFQNEIVLLAVDNHKTRKAVSDLCSSCNDTTLISGGNELTDGNVQVYIRRAGTDITPKLDKYHPEIASPKDKAPFEQSCEELSQSSPQILATNLMVASAMLNEFWREVQNPVRIDHHSEIYLDILENVSTRRERR